MKGKALLIYWLYESGREDYSAKASARQIKRLGSVKDAEYVAKIRREVEELDRALRHETEAAEVQRRRA